MRCRAAQEEEPLRVALQKLGVQNDTLTGDSCQWPGVACKALICFVEGINLEGIIEGSGLLPEELGQLLRLLSLNLRGFQVQGSLRPLAPCKHLRKLWLDGGRFEEVPVTQLRRLVLTGTQIDFAELRGAKKLEYLYLQRPKAVRGDLADLQKAKRLSLARLAGAPVTGDLGVLREMAELRVLDLARTQVNGSLEALANKTLLTKLSLGGTMVHGELKTMQTWPALRKVDLSGTQVQGTLFVGWRGRLKDLTRLNLRDTKVRFPTGGDRRDALQVREHQEDALLLPSLQMLDVSGTRLEARTEDILIPFLSCKALASVKAARCGLQGPLPDFTHLIVRNNDRLHTRRDWPLFVALRTLDVSQNRIQELKWLSSGLRRLVLRGGGEVAFGPLVLEGAMRRLTFLDLRQTRLSPAQARTYFGKGTLKATKVRTFFSEEASFSCRGIENPMLSVTSQDFAPDLLCTCLAGWEGDGANCSRCPNGTYREYNHTGCARCPGSSTSAGGAKSAFECICGSDQVVFRRPDGSYACGCRAMYALIGEDCRDCHKLHLHCEKAGSSAANATPAAGYARLRRGAEHVFQCLVPAKTRCNSSEEGAVANPLGCAPGYDGRLCSMCAEQHRSHGRQCRKCQRLDAQTSSCDRWYC